MQISAACEEGSDKAVPVRGASKFFQEGIEQITAGQALTGDVIRTRVGIAIQSLPEKKVTRDSIPRLVRAVASSMALEASSLATCLGGGVENMSCNVSWMDEAWFHSEGVQGVLSDYLPALSKAHKVCGSIADLTAHVSQMIDGDFLPLVPTGTLELLLEQFADKEGKAAGVLTRNEFVKVLVFLAMYSTSQKGIGKRKVLADRLEQASKYFSVLKLKSPTASSRSAKKTPPTPLLGNSMRHGSSTKRAFPSPQKSRAPLSGASSSGLRQSMSPRPQPGFAGRSVSGSKPPPLFPCDSSSQSGVASYGTAQGSVSSFTASTALSVLQSNGGSSKSSHPSKAPPLSTPISSKFTQSDFLPSPESMTMESKPVTPCTPTSSRTAAACKIRELTKKKEALMQTKLARLGSEVRLLSTQSRDIAKIVLLLFFLALVVLVGLDAVGQLDGLPRSYSSSLV